ncbi:MAG TPA: nucleotide exchange factor GrpE [Candidatus Limnocylindrales bacterium]|nr:nucleotide exchange factor GrpE [Candidatus Limnocylindrales bacterium]
MPDLRDLRGRPIGRTNGGGRPAAPNQPARSTPGPGDPANGGPAAPDVRASAGPNLGQRTRAQERIDELDVSPTKLLADIERLKAELADAQSKSDEYLAGLQRERAEFNNYRRRTAEEREQMLGLAGEDLIRKVLAIADDFDLAIDNRPAELAGNSWVDGVSAIDRKLRTLLDSEGVSSIEAAPGMAFDPRAHEAIANVPGTGRPEGEIVDVVRRGYKLRDRILRPALVAVAAGDSTTQPAADAAPTN